MGVVRKIGVERSVPALKDAIEGFLAGVSNPNTARAYATALRALTEKFGSYTPMTVFEGEAAADRVAAWFIERWGSASAATVNARLNALSSAVGWWRIRAGSSRTRCAGSSGGRSRPTVPVP